MSTNVIDTAHRGIPGAAASPSWRALTTGAAWFRRPDSSVLVLEDADRVDFLQRMTTNDIKALRPGQAAVTVLTSPTARIVHVFTVLCRADDLILLPAPGEGPALERHLRGQIFFMDKVRVRNQDAAWRRLRVVGPQAGAAVAALGMPANLAERQRPESINGVWVEADGVIALADQRYELPGFELLVPAAEEAVAAVEQALAEAGGVQVEEMALLDARRIELGLPAPGAELTGAANPLEAGLAWACADNKGCYTGQEIIARQITYDKVTRALVGLRCGEGVEPGALLYADGREVGIVTSAAYSPTLASLVALAIVKRPHNAAGSRLSLRPATNPEENGVAVDVVALPLVSA